MNHKPIERKPFMNLRRVDDGKLIAGVAAGLARSLGIDANIIRIGFAALSIFVGGGLWLYLILWVLMPRESGGTIAEEGIGRAKTWYDDRKKNRGPRDYDI